MNINVDEINQLSRNEADNEEKKLDNKTSDMNIDTAGIDDANSKLDELSNKIANVIKELMQPFKDAWNNMGDWFKSKLDYFKESFKFMVEKIKELCVDLWENGLKLLVQHLAELGIAIGGMFLEVYGVMFESIGKLAEYLKPSNNPITKNMIAALDTLVLALKDFFMGIGQGFKDFMENGGNDLLQKLADGVNLVITAFATIGTTIVNTLGEILEYLNPVNNEFTKLFLEKTGEVMVKIGEFANAVASAFQYLMDNGLRECLKVLGDVVMIIGTALMEALSAIIGWVTDFFNSWAGHAILSVVGGLLEIIANILKTLAQVIKIAIEWIIKIGDAIKNYFLDKSEKMKNSLSGVKEKWEGVINWFRKLPENFKTIGKNIINGLVNGIKSMVMAPVNAIKNIGTKVKDKFKSLFGINSPSKVFTEYGDYLMQGLNNGINKGKNSVVNDIDNVANDINTKGENAFTNMTTNMLNPFEEVVNQLKEISNQIQQMFNFGIGMDIQSNISKNVITSMATSASIDAVKTSNGTLAAMNVSDTSQLAKGNNMEYGSASIDYDKLANSIMRAAGNKDVIINIDKRELGRATINAINQDTQLNGKSRLRIK